MALRRHIALDPHDYFLSWSTIIATMFVGNAPYTAEELHVLQGASDWERWRKAIQEDRLGYPEAFNEYASGNLIHQAYHLLQWERVTKLKVNDLETIVEIGAGYGALAKVIRRLGFEGRYVIFDLPEFEYLQQWYLGRLGIKAEWGPIAPGHFRCDLLIALWSLSEMKETTQDEYLSGLLPRHYMIAALDAPWEGEDNARYLRALETHEGVKRQIIPHLRGNFYLLG